MSDTTIEVRRREKIGKNHNRRARASGRVPAVVYGGGLDSFAVDVENRTLERILRSSGENTLFKLSLEGTEQTRPAMLRDIQYEPRTGQLIHLDFLRILLDEKITVKVPIEIVGLAEGVKNEEGMVDFITRELEVECLPSNIPQVLELDVTHLHVGQHVDAGEIELPEGVTLVDEPDRTIVSIAKARVEIEEEEPEEEEAEDLIEAATEEPEVVSRDSGE